jgi:acetyl esterase
MLHPQARALIDLLQSRGIPPVHTLTPDEARRFYRERRGFTQPDPPEVALVEDLQAPGPAGPIPVRHYRPLGSDATQRLPVLVYFHGGGWTIGDLDTHDTLCRQLANGAGCAVVSVDYRMGPEHRFPAAVDDCLAATRWVRGEAARLRIDPARIAVGGDSAGGNLAAVVALCERDGLDGLDGQPGQEGAATRTTASGALAFQLLIYPATDMTLAGESHRTNGQGYLLTRDSIHYYRSHYIADASQWQDWRASPLLHPDLSGLPPALVITAGFDPLRDEGLAYAQRLTEAGTRCTYACFERQIHGFALMGKVLHEADTAVAMAAAALRASFEGRST